MGKLSVTEVTKKSLRLISFILLFRKLKNSNSLILKEYIIPNIP